ncbi:hypothetical protein FXB39_07510 [Nocardioides sp. BGMRC 2183]|nr:hypothetical protein FXB39_07510 [Nocardioides sp. BGMRC 2183]
MRRFDQRDERGATAILVSVLMALVLMVSAAFAVDLGQQRVLRSDLQAVADLAALDLAQQLDGSRIEDYDTGEFDTALREAIARNDDAFGRVLVREDLTSCTRLSSEPWGYCWQFVEIGDNGRWTPVHDGAARPDAVVVQIASQTSFAFADIAGREAGGASVSAVGHRPEPSACYELGSFSAALDLGSSMVGPLARLVGLDAALSIADYRALAGGEVTLAGLAASPEIGSTGALLGPSRVRIGALLDATAAALARDGGPGAAAAISVLNGLLDASAGLNLDDRVDLNDVISVDVGDLSALTAELNVLELIGAALAIANNGGAALEESVDIELDALGLPVDGDDATASLSATAIQGLRFACGAPGSEEATAEQSQVTLKLLVPALRIPVVDAEVGSVVHGSFDLTVGEVLVRGGIGNATATLASVDQCGSGTTENPDAYSVTVDSGLAGVDLSAPVALDGEATINATEGNGVLRFINDILDLGDLADLLEMLSGGLINTYPRYRNFQLSVHSDLAFDLSARAPGMTESGTGSLRVPENLRTSGTKVSVPPEPAPISLGDVALPRDSSIEGGVSVRATFQRKDGLFAEWDDRSRSLGSFKISRLSEVPVIGSLLQAALTQTTTVLNSGVVAAANDLLGTLRPLVGLSGAGADLHSVSRPSCDTAPQLVD